MAARSIPAPLRKKFRIWWPESLCEKAREGVYRRMEAPLAIQNEINRSTHVAKDVTACLKPVANPTQTFSGGKMPEEASRPAASKMTSRGGIFCDLGPPSSISVDLFNKYLGSFLGAEAVDNVER